MRTMLTGVLCAVMALPVTASAQTKRAVEARYSRDYTACMATGDAAQGTTSGIMDCIGSEIDRQDARLNRAYKMVMIRLSADQKARLRSLERAWISERDTRCQRAAAPEEGGSLARIIYAGCIMDETIKRTMWLESYRPGSS